jgi:copper(I)-binding protein
MKSISRASAALLAVLLTAGAAAAAGQTVTAGSLVIANPWTDATPPGAPTATGYVTITNHGSTPDRLVGVSSPLANTGELHQMSVANGIASMHPIDGIDIPAGATLTLTPTTFHMMFVTLMQPLKQGSEMPVTLRFQKAGSVEVSLQVLAIGATGPGPGK